MSADPAADWTCSTNRVEATRDLGIALGRVVQPGNVIALSGNLGAGKTHFTQGIAEGAGVDRRLVSSPTFSLIQEYAGRLPIFHFDTYRLKNIDEFLDLGFDEYLSLRGVCIIEWAERVTEVLPADTLTIRITSTGETTREFQWRARGLSAQKTLDMLRKIWHPLDSDLNSTSPPYEGGAGGV